MCLESLNDKKSTRDNHQNREKQQNTDKEYYSLFGMAVCILGHHCTNYLNVKTKVLQELLLESIDFV